MNTGETSTGKIEDLDIVIISNLQTTVAVYKLSDCFFIGGEILSELPEHPIYTSTLDQTNGFNGKANSDYRNTKYETYIHFVNACLSSSVKTYKKQ